jgi:hypothetical protein
MMNKKKLKGANENEWKKEPFSFPALRSCVLAVEYLLHSSLPNAAKLFTIVTITVAE